jgi:hypothetical protein
MGQILAQVALQRVIQSGFEKIKDDPSILDSIFMYYLDEELASDYGQPYVNGIKQWFANTTIPVVQAWAINPERIPQVSIHLGGEGEDESKAAINDFFGDGESSEIDVSAFTVNLDIGLHASKSSDAVLWLYSIVSYVLFKNKRLAEKLGLQLHTFSATDFEKKMPMFDNNVYSRWIKFRCTVANTWDGPDFTEIDEIKVVIEPEQPTGD